MATSRTPPACRRAGQVLALQAVVERFDGTVHQLVAEERGATLIAAWGLAGVTHEDDARRGIEAALGMHAELTRLAVPCRRASATGRLFCGVRGSETRREWAIVGDRMNLAARLLAPRRRPAVRRQHRAGRVGEAALRGRCRRWR